MAFPFVSRERLQEVQDRLDASEQERKVLMDRIAMLRGEPPLFATVPVPVVPADQKDTQPLRVTESSVAEKAPPKNVLAGSVTADYVLSKAAEAVKQNKVQRVG